MFRIRQNQMINFCKAGYGNELMLPNTGKSRADSLIGTQINNREREFKRSS